MLDMAWPVLFHDAFEPEFTELVRSVQDELSAHLLLLRERGPQRSRPAVDPLKGSKHAIMKELRFRADGGVARRVPIRPSPGGGAPGCPGQVRRFPEVLRQDADSAR